MSEPDDDLLYADDEDDDDYERRPVYRPRCECGKVSHDDLRGAVEFAAVHDEPMTVYPCGTVYHLGRSRPELVANAGTCPLCKQAILPTELVWRQCAPEVYEEALEAAGLVPVFSHWSCVRRLQNDDDFEDEAHA